MATRPDRLAQLRAAAARDPDAWGPVLRRFEAAAQFARDRAAGLVSGLFEDGAEPVSRRAELEEEHRLQELRERRWAGGVS